MVNCQRENILERIWPPPSLFFSVKTLHFFNQFGPQKSFRFNLFFDRSIFIFAPKKFGESCVCGEETATLTPASAESLLQGRLR